MSEEILPRELTSPTPRRGKWSLEEERYTEKIIMDFENGTLDVPEGTTLRTHLAKVLNCDPMRITKKYTGNSSIGKRTFLPLVRCPDNAHFIEMSQRDLLELRRAWVSKLLLAEQWNHRKISMIRSGYEAQQGELTSASTASSSSSSSSLAVPSDGHSYLGSTPLGIEDLLLQEESDEQMGHREENIRRALRPHLRDPSEIERCISWLRASCRVLRQPLQGGDVGEKNSRLEELNVCIQAGEASVPLMYQLITSGSKGNGGETKPSQLEHLQKAIEAYFDHSAIPSDVSHRVYKLPRREEREGEDSTATTTETATTMSGSPSQRSVQSQTLATVPATISADAAADPSSESTASVSTTTAPSPVPSPAAQSLQSPYVAYPPPAAAVAGLYPPFLPAVYGPPIDWPGWQSLARLPPPPRGAQPWSVLAAAAAAQGGHPYPSEASLAQKGEEAEATVAATGDGSHPTDKAAAFYPFPYLLPSPASSSSSASTATSTTSATSTDAAAAAIPPATLTASTSAAHVSSAAGPIPGYASRPPRTLPFRREASTSTAVPTIMPFDRTSRPIVLTASQRLQHRDQLAALPIIHPILDGVPVPVQYHSFPPPPPSTSFHSSRMAAGGEGERGRGTKRPRESQAAAMAAMAANPVEERNMMQRYGHATTQPLPSSIASAAEALLGLSHS